MKIIFTHISGLLLVAPVDCYREKQSKSTKLKKLGKLILKFKTLYKDYNKK